jgi:hypothetical protein
LSGWFDADFRTPGTYSHEVAEESIRPFASYRRSRGSADAKDSARKVGIAETDVTLAVTERPYFVGGRDWRAESMWLWQGQW